MRRPNTAAGEKIVSIGTFQTWIMHQKDPALHAFSHDFSTQNAQNRV